MEPDSIPRDQHPVSRSMIDPDVVRILYRLKHEGYQAYVVGGAIRDILRGEHEPKDFDIATDARPMELRRLFRNSRIIGRRFRLVHIFFGQKNIEVATLRRTVQPDADGGLLQSEADLDYDDDRMWGTLETDAMRRDFTCNALYYSIHDFSIIDYVGGVQDVKTVSFVPSAIRKFAFAKTLCVCSGRLNLLRVLNLSSKKQPRKQFTTSLEKSVKQVASALPKKFSYFNAKKSPPWPEPTQSLWPIGSYLPSWLQGNRPRRP